MYKDRIRKIETAKKYCYLPDVWRMNFSLCRARARKRISQFKKDI